jgi:hypothetical protein
VARTHTDSHQSPGQFQLSRHNAFQHQGHRYEVVRRSEQVTMDAKGNSRMNRKAIIFSRNRVLEHQSSCPWAKCGQFREFRSRLSNTTRRLSGVQGLTPKKLPEAPEPRSWLGTRPIAADLHHRRSAATTRLASPHQRRWALKMSRLVFFQVTTPGEP